MKRVIRIIFLFQVYLFYSQEYHSDKVMKVTYINNEMPKRFMSANYIPSESYLYITDSYSQFIRDSKERTYDIKERFQVTFPYLKYYNNYDFQTKKIEENRILDDKTVLYSEWKNDLVWEITDEEKEINGYKVRKAITNSFEIPQDDEEYYGKAIAWFAIDIPIPSGPGRYYGLPGLILELKYENTSRSGYELKDIEYISKSEYQFMEVNKENPVEKEDLIYYFHKNPDKIKEIQKKKREKK